jgi:hypothetical protein
VCEQRFAHRIFPLFTAFRGRAAREVA